MLAISAEVRDRGRARLIAELAHANKHDLGTRVQKKLHRLIY
jgi:hypothetical protein